MPSPLRITVDDADWQYKWTDDRCIRWCNAPGRTGTRENGDPRAVRAEMCRPGARLTAGEPTEPPSGAADDDSDVVPGESSDGDDGADDARPHQVGPVAVDPGCRAGGSGPRIPWRSVRVALHAGTVPAVPWETESR